MYAYEIDDNGFIINNYLTIGDVPIPNGCITVQLPQPLPFYKSKWNGKEWIEGVTQEEIDEIIKPKPPLPATESRLDEIETTLNLLMLGGI